LYAFYHKQCVAVSLVIFRPAGFEISQRSGSITHIGQMRTPAAFLKFFPLGAGSSDQDGEEIAVARPQKFARL
jgi:hypothetical protein